MSTINELKVAATQVRDASVEAENTALRVGTVLVDVVDAVSAKLDKAAVVQTSGDSESNVMSQQAVTSLLSAKLDVAKVVHNTGVDPTKVMSQMAVTDALNKKLDKTVVVQDSGYSVDNVMSQQAVTFALNKKQDTLEIAQATGSSETAVMSQKAVTGAINTIDAIKSVDIAAINFDAEALLKFSYNNEGAVLYRVIDNNIPVGLLMMFSDSMNHIVNQVLYTNYDLNDNGTINSGSHHHKYQQYYRYYAINDTTSAVPDDTWGAWKSVHKDIEDRIALSEERLTNGEDNIDMLQSDLVELQETRRVLTGHINRKTETLYFDEFVSGDIAVEENAVAMTYDGIAYSWSLKRFVAYTDNASTGVRFYIPGWVGCERYGVCDEKGAAAVEQRLYVILIDGNYHIYTLNSNGVLTDLLRDAYRIAQAAMPLNPKTDINLSSSKNVAINADDMVLHAKDGGTILIKADHETEDIESPELDPDAYTGVNIIGGTVMINSTDGSLKLNANNTSSLIMHMNATLHARTNIDLNADSELNFSCDETATITGKKKVRLTTKRFEVFNAAKEVYPLYVKVGDTSDEIKMRADADNSVTINSGGVKLVGNTTLKNGITRSETQIYEIADAKPENVKEQELQCWLADDYDPGEGVLAFPLRQNVNNTEYTILTTDAGWWTNYCDGLVSSDSEGNSYINYGKAALVAIKALTAKVKALEERISVLES